MNNFLPPSSTSSLAVPLHENSKNVLRFKRSIPRAVVKSRSTFSELFYLGAGFIGLKKFLKPHENSHSSTETDFKSAVITTKTMIPSVTTSKNITRKIPDFNFF